MAWSPHSLLFGPRWSSSQCVYHATCTLISLFPCSDVERPRHGLGDPGCCLGTTRASVVPVSIFCRCGRIEKFSLSFSVDNHDLAMKLTIYWQWLPPESGMDMDPILTAPGAGAIFQSNSCFGRSNPRYSSDLFHGPHTEVSSRSHTLQQRRLFHRPIAQIPRRQSCQHVRGDVLPRKVFVPDGLYDSRWDSVWSSDLLRFGNVRRFSECDGSV